MTHELLDEEIRLLARIRNRQFSSWLMFAAAVAALFIIPFLIAFAVTRSLPDALDIFTQARSEFSLPLLFFLTIWQIARYGRFDASRISRFVAVSVKALVGTGLVGADEMDEILQQLAEKLGEKRQRRVLKELTRDGWPYQRATYYSSYLGYLRWISEIYEAQEIRLAILRGEGFADGWPAREFLRLMEIVSTAIATHGLSKQAKISQTIKCISQGILVTALLCVPVAFVLAVKPDSLGFRITVLISVAAFIWVWVYQIRRILKLW